MGMSGTDRIVTRRAALGGLGAGALGLALAGSRAPDSPPRTIPPHHSRPRMTSSTARLTGSTCS